MQAATCGTAINAAEYEPVRFLDVLHQVPLLIQTVPATSWGNLMACCKDTRHIVQANVRSIIIQVVTLPSHRDWTAPPAPDQPAFQSSSTSRDLIKVQVPHLTKTSGQGRWPLLSRLLLAGGVIDRSALCRMMIAAWQLTSLCLSNISLKPDAIVFFRVSTWPNLADLDLSYNSWESNDTQAVSALVSASWPKLQTLNLRCCQLTGQSVALISHADWPLLRCLDICSVYASVQDIQPTLAAQWPGMSRLVLGFVFGAGVELQQSLMVFLSALKSNAWPLLSVQLSSKALDTDLTLRLLQGNFP